MSNRIAVLAMARTAATLKCVSILQKVNIKYYGELLKVDLDDLNNNVITLNSMLDADHGFLVKIFPNNFTEESVRHVNWSKFDEIHFVHRISVVDQLLSTLVATKTDQWIRVKDVPWARYTEKIVVTDSEISEFVDSLAHRDLIEGVIRQTVQSDRITVSYYEDHLKLPVNTARATIVPTNYDYTLLCDNYVYTATQIAALIENKICQEKKTKH